MNTATATAASPALLETRLHASPAERLPFAPRIAVRAFLLPRREGNVVVYASAGADAAWAAEHGGAARQYLGHAHEARFATSGVGAPLFANRADAPTAGRHVAMRATFSRRHRLDDDFEAIPTPGHTPGATTYRWHDGERRYLFTGDTIYLDRGEWRGALLRSSDRGAYLESLDLLRGLEFDVLVPWAASAGGPYLAATDAADASRRIGALMDRLWRGEDG